MNQSRIFTFVLNCTKPFIIFTAVRTNNAHFISEHRRLVSRPATYLTYIPLNQLVILMSIQVT